MARNFLALVAGLIALVLGLVVVDVVSRSAFPVALELRSNDPEHLRAMFAALPTSTVVVLVAAWFIGPLVGALTARWIGTGRWPLWTIVGLSAFCVAIMVAVLPMPAMLQVAWVAAPIVAGLIAHHFGPTRRRVAAIEPIDTV